MMTQELDLEDPLAIVQRLNADDGAALVAALTDDEAQTLVDRLKAGADKYWAINPNRSLEMADTIIKIAEGRDNLSHKALGMMARGDALKHLGKSEEAWLELEKAGKLFLYNGNKIGWARTRIGRLYLCVSVNRVAEALADGERARAIFTDLGIDDFLVRLDFNTGWVYYVLGDHERALRWYNSSLMKVESSNFSEQQFLGIIYTNLGVVYHGLLGDFQTALYYYQRAYEFAIKRNETKNIALAELNKAYVVMEQGQYSQALRLLYHAHDQYITEQLYWDAAHVNKLIVECYLTLNRYKDAQELALQVLAEFRKFGEAYGEARTLLQLATAEAELSELGEAQKTLNQAEKLFTDLEATSWIAEINLRRGQLALKQGNVSNADTVIKGVVAFFKLSGHKIHYSAAMLLQSHVFFAFEDIKSAKKSAIIALSIAHKARVPLLRYGAHLLLGRIAEMQGDFISAIRRYRAAISTIEHVQQSLTIIHWTGFLENKTEALYALIALYIRLGDRVNAFEILERAKSQAFLNYISNQQLLHWPQSDQKCIELIQELDQLRGEHHWWYQKTYNKNDKEETYSKNISSEKALKEVTQRERRMRAITEQLYLQSGLNVTLFQANAPRLQTIQQYLDEKSLLIEFYHDNLHIWIFTVSKSTCNIYSLPAPLAEIERNLDFLHFSIDIVLNSQNDLLRHPILTKQTRQLLHQLHYDLLGPLVTQIQKYRKLIIVPYGFLHYLPFHLLYTGSSYLIEQYEITILPAAGYVTQKGPERARGARVIAHSLNGALPHAIDEAEFIHDLFGGSVCAEDNASRSALQETPTQILHIATHAEYRQQQPDLSYIELADGQLFTDDLFQQDMSYELVTLSACETGRSYVASSDELIGLGRGFLYAGAGALVTSLWRVIDDVTPRLMKYFYRELYAGASKAAALRTAQLAILSENPQMHPAFWGAFQLVGDPRPLSSNPSAKNTQ